MQKLAFLRRSQPTLVAFAASALLGALAFAATVYGDGVAGVFTAKRIPPATVAIIDPESGTSSGGGTTDVRVGPGDVVLFRFQVYPVPDKIIRGLNGYLTEYVPNNTRVVGARLVDQNGVTIPPNLPGIAVDGCARPCNGFNSVACTPGVGGCPGTGTRNLGDGSISEVIADTGLFYSTDARTAKNPNNAFLTLSNGINMGSSAPRYVANVSGILGASSPYFVHNTWDWIQIRAFGSMPSASGNGGNGNGPEGYGSPVAGSGAFYQFEATEVAGSIRFNNVVGPWQRVAYPGSHIGSEGSSPDSESLLRVSVPTTSGFDLKPATPLPVGTNALRFATGEIRVGSPIFAEVALRVEGTPLDTLMMRDADCAEFFGADTSAASDSVRARDNPWSVYLASPACVFLNLLFDLDIVGSVPARPVGLAVTGDRLTYRLRTKNLSTQTQTNVFVRQRYDSTRVAFVTGSATGGGTNLGSCDDGSGLACLRWGPFTLAPSDELSFDSQFDIGGGGHVTSVMFANYRSTALPAPGFTTQAITMTKGVGVMAAALTPPARILAGGSGAFTGSISNSGTEVTQFDSFTLVLPTGWSLTTAAVTLGGVTLSCPDRTTNLPVCSIGSSFNAGESRALSFTVEAPGGTGTGLYPIDLQVWSSQSGFGGSSETYFNDLATVAVGQFRSTPPVLDCSLMNGPPITSASTTVPGTTVEGTGTVIRVYFNLQERGTTTTTAPMQPWSVGTFGPGSTFGPLYGGLEVRATAQAPGELESPLSAPCEARFVPVCSDGVDNDMDGFTDFPGDIGCSSPSDSTEGDPQCSDGVDNEPDTFTDWPADPECTGPEDNTEAGSPACGNGMDDDGDGATDFPADSGCTSAADRSEITYRQCMDGLDNDGDGDFDYPDDPGCHSSNDNSETDFTTADVNARVLVVFDTSGSMNWHVCADATTGGDGSMECAGADVACATCNTTGCGNGIADDSRLFKVKRGITDAVTAFGEVEWGLMRFHQRPIAFACPGANASLGGGGWQGAGAAPCGGGFSGGDLLVRFDSDNAYDLLEWMDSRDNYTVTPPPALDFELRGSGTTAIAGSLQTALDELTAMRTADPRGACRPYRVILVTDGAETCGGNPVASATALFNAGFETDVIGFATPDMNVINNLNAIANAGAGNTMPATPAIFADNSVALSGAIADIIEDTVLIETCNNVDDDCDVLIDEGFPKYCNRPMGITTSTLCVDPGETVCNNMDDNCNGVVDEGVRNACGLCGPLPSETCDGLDNNCNGMIDEGACSCVPAPETCNNLDDDCDMMVDEGVTRACGTDVGACTVGTQTCSAGVFGTCTGIQPTTETCNGIDDNCDGVVDGITRPCGSSVGDCRPGTQTCMGGVWGMTCAGSTGPTAEVCDNRDNNCNGSTDEGNPGGGAPCGSAIGECNTGTLTCQMGAFVCIGGTGPTAEACDNQDDDCDGATDEGVASQGPCGTATGECETGLLQCMGGSFMCVGGRGPATEVCNGLDDNCNGTTDEGNPGGGVACGTATGECNPGTTACSMGMTVCQGATGPTPEMCDNQDDDCDGATDEGIASPGPCGTSVGECEPGVQQCASGTFQCVGARGPVAETCNNRDDNCNGQTDEGNPGGGATCGTGTGECSTGSLTCVSGALTCSGGVGPVVETCNMLDDDCDSRIDENNPGGGLVCGTDVGECSVGTTRCVMGAVQCQGAVVARSELCNGLDDDCDGSVDENNPGGGASCGTNTGECTAGMLQCVGGALSCTGAVGPTLDLCDSLDNDCDSRTDENNPGGGAPCGSSVGACRPGTLRCTGGMLVCGGQTGAGPEACNNADDDCDGVTDEEVAPRGPCGPSEGECEPGLDTCVNGSFTCVGARGPATEICDGRDNDCNGMTDEGNPGGGVICGSSTGNCEPGVTECRAGVLMCTGQTGAVPERCNTEDDDCDALVDEGNPDGGASCGTTDVGECDFGALTCVGGTLSCVGEELPSEERCDGLDNDCDMMIDENDPEGGMACGDDTGECNPGTTRCVTGMLVCEGGVLPVPEVCNGLDDDCDGVNDDGIPVGAPCGSDIGECEPGRNVCRDGMIRCDGATDAIDELCDLLDNDCDGTSDEALASPGPCGTDVGLCMPGMLQCVGGTEICSGGVPPANEVCDCEDNDCDGNIDETSTDDPVCPGESACINCGCALRCVEDEFGARCPEGREAQVLDGMCWCVMDRCREEECATETIDRDGTVLCAPNTDGTPSCICRENNCTFPCDGVVCTDPTICNPENGRCVENNCRGLGCPEGQLCDVAALECVADPCAGIRCGDDQVCRDGMCEASCASVMCMPGERCERGECVSDLCTPVMCTPPQVCSPRDGTCVDDLCAGVMCGTGLACDPATGDCERDRCFGVRCPTMQMCVDGECVMMAPPDAGPPPEVDAGAGTDTGAGPPPDRERRVFGTGGGGCLCGAPGRTGEGDAPVGFGLGLLGLALVSRRARSRR